MKCVVTHVQSLHIASTHSMYLGLYFFLVCETWSLTLKEERKLRCKRVPKSGNKRRLEKFAQ